MSSSSFNTNRQHQQLLNKQQLQRHHNQEVAHAREAAHEAQQEHAQAARQAQGRYGDTVFRTVPMPPGPPPRQNKSPPHRSEVRQRRADGKDDEREDPVQPESAERRENPGQERVEGVDRDGQGHQQHQHHEGSHGGNDQAGGFGGGHSGSHSGGHSGGGHSGGQSGGQSSHSGGQSGQGGGQGGQARQQAPGRFGAPAAGRAASLPPSLAAAQSNEVQAFRRELAGIDLPERRARYLAEAMVALSKPGRHGGLNSDAMMMSLMAAYVENSVEPGALATLAKVKQVLLELGPSLTGALPPGPRERNRLALLPLKLLVVDRQRTEAQRLIAAERLRAGQRWPSDTLELET
jgi:hypothetical protein